MKIYKMEMGPTVLLNTLQPGQMFVFTDESIQKYANAQGLAPPLSELKGMICARSKNPEVTMGNFGFTRLSDMTQYSAVLVGKYKVHFIISISAQS